MNFLQRHITKLLLYLVMLGTLNFLHDPPEEEIPSNKLPPLSLQSKSKKEAYAQSDTDSNRAPSDWYIKSLASIDSYSQEMDIAKTTKSTHPLLAKNLSPANDNLNIIPYIAAVLLTSCILLFLILRNFRKQNSKPQLSAPVYTTLSSDDQSHHTRHLDHNRLHLEDHHPRQSIATQQLERHAWEQYDTNPLQFCGYDADYLLSLSEDTPAWNTVIHEVKESAPIITQKGINSIGDCMFDTFYDRDTIELHCELLQPPKTRANGKAPKPKQRDAQKILEQLEKERTKAANHVFHQHILDLLKEETDAESTEAAKFTDSLLNRIEACKLAYRMMQCFSAKADYQSTSTSEAEAPSSHFPTNTKDTSTATDTAPEAAFATSPSIENRSRSRSPSSATAQEEAARKIALKLQQVFHSKEAEFVKDFKARIQERVTTMEQTTVKGQEMSEKEKEEKAVKGIKAGIQASAPQVANQFGQAITKSIAHVPSPSDANQSSSNVVNDLLQDRLATATKQLLVQACLHVMTHIQQATKWRGYGQRQRFDSS